MLLAQVGTAIKTRRKSLGLRQSDLAEIAGVSPNTLYKLERGQNNPSLDVVEKLCDALGLEFIIQVKQNKL